MAPVGICFWEELWTGGQGIIKWTFTQKEFNIPGRTAIKSINPVRDALNSRTVNIDPKLGYEKINFTNFFPCWHGHFHLHCNLEYFVSHQLVYASKCEGVCLSACVQPHVWHLKRHLFNYSIPLTPPLLLYYECERESPNPIILHAPPFATLSRCSLHLWSCLTI